MAPEPQALNAVLERLSRPEKQNRPLKWMGVTRSQLADIVICHQPDFELGYRCASDDRETAGGFLNRPCELGARA